MNSDIRNHYTVTVRNKSESIQGTSEEHTPNDECKNFVTGHIEAAAKYISTKPKA